MKIIEWNMLREFMHKLFQMYHNWIINYELDQVLWSPAI